MSVLLTVLGILLLISAFKSLMAEDELDAPPPRWMTRIDGAAPGTVFGFGLLITLIAPKLWVFTLSAIAVIRSATLTPTQGLTTYLLYLLGAQSAILIPLVITAIAPRQSRRILQSLSEQLIKYKSQISLVVSLVFGVLFLWKGLSG
jgi:threonine/homoserine/homoserine lactone efflux protein